MTQTVTLPVTALATPPRATTEAPARQGQTRPIEETLPPYVVILHNDDHNTMDGVVYALLASVPELDIERAVEVMLAAHHHGQADVISCPLERAELYRDRLEQRGLTATIRKA
ncbi:MAG: ATP-dependent Clp protease adaptor ClpS [Dehalococcoidia bacterium]|nr:ATP-dependent Clp protease adaptor ClpS [Dehalococcoidia bacterium]